jgi:DNA polymerase III psi subunit
MLKIVENRVSGLKEGLSVSRCNYWDMPENKGLSCEAMRILANAALSQLSYPPTHRDSVRFEPKECTIFGGFFLARIR